MPNLTSPELYTLRMLVQGAQRLQVEAQAAQAALEDYSKRLEMHYGQNCTVDIVTGLVTLQSPEDFKGA